MIHWRWGAVTAVTSTGPGVMALEVDVAGQRRQALAYPQLIGSPEVGDRVLLNTTAQDLGLGTGGYALVVAVPDRLPAQGTERGHLVKARYTPLQAVVLGADEPDSPYHDQLKDADELHGMPVVVADLHSALPAIVAGIAADRPATRVVYVMTDGGALPIWFSRNVAALRAASALVGTVTVGQAYGGDLEAVTVHTGLLAALHAFDAEVAVVTQGPGNLGTGTRWGFSGVAVGDVVNAAAALGGRPVGALRVSAVDPRPRHRGVSHHSLTAYGRVALASCDIVVPQLPDPLGADIKAAVASLPARHRLVDVPVDGLYQALAGCTGQLESMGRGYDDDPAAFLASAAAGRHAAALLERGLSSR